MRKAPQGSKNKGPNLPPLKSKVAKGKCGKKKPKATQQITLSPSLLGVMNDGRDCACEIVARTVRDHVHAHLGLPNRHEHPQPTDTEPTEPK